MTDSIDSTSHVNSDQNQQPNPRASSTDSIGSSGHVTCDQNQQPKTGASCTDSLCSMYGSSDECYDPYCEPCEESRGKNVKVECFCNECSQYLCTDCYTIHKSLRASRGHVIQTGDDMPKSMAEKPPRYDTCDNHPKQHKDLFCPDHEVLVCSACCPTSHSMCDTMSVANICQYVHQSEIDNLCDVNKYHKSQLMKFLSSVDKHGGKLKEQKNTMLKDAQTTYDKLLAAINRTHQNIKTAIQAEYNSQEAAVSQLQQEIKSQLTRVDSEINFTNKVRGSLINVNTFLSLYESISNTRENAAAFESLHDSQKLTSLNFEPSKDIQQLISYPVGFGFINKTSAKVDVHVGVPAVKVPISVKPLSGAVTTFNGITKEEDKSNCHITGIAITPSGQRLLVDCGNEKVYLFSKDMRFESSVSVPREAWDITIVNDREAVVTAGSSLVFLKVIDTELRIKHRIKLPFGCRGITYIKDKLIVTDLQTIRAVDLRGRELWSQSLFMHAYYVCSNKDGRWVAFTDNNKSKNSVTVLDPNNGTVIARRRLKKGRWPIGVAVDTRDNIYVCTNPSIIVVSRDLQNEVLYNNDQGHNIQAIAYDKQKGQFILSYFQSTDVSSFHMS